MAWKLHELENVIAFTMSEYNEDRADYSAVEDLLFTARNMGYEYKNGRLQPIQNQVLKLKTMYNNNRSYSNNNYNPRGYNNNQRQQRREDVKRSGATYTTIRKGKREGMIAVTAWRKTKMGLMTAKAFPVSEEVFTSQNGNEYMRYAVEVSNASMGTNTTYWCLMSLKTKKIVIQQLSLVISPNGSGYTSSGKKVSGFFGANYKRR